ncbi:hypothetical protein NP233_g10335 [Leucocoprinus birnbaumii]|uniref:Uncharacterized protein n=1 Tax=Leucocoprinus birnbaumii TaxID=56174 RepID=A0AAD5VPG6_9AGAR|nr:hypothetical protein NP233_g10335 [Leucocoprinus birnbaumii]
MGSPNSKPQANLQQTSSPGDTSHQEEKYTPKSVAHWHAHLDVTEEKLRQKTNVYATIDEERVRWYHTLRQEEDEIRELALADCVCHHEPNCPNSEVFPALEGYNKTRKANCSMLGRDLEFFLKADERLKARKQCGNVAFEFENDPPAYSESTSVRLERSCSSQLGSAQKYQEDPEHDLEASYRAEKKNALTSSLIGPKS